MSPDWLGLMSSSLGLLLVLTGLSLAYLGLKAVVDWKDDTQPLAVVLAVLATGYVFRMLADMGWIQPVLAVLSGTLIYLLSITLSEEDDLNKDQA